MAQNAEEIMMMEIMHPKLNLLGAMIFLVAYLKIAAKMTILQ